MPLDLFEFNWLRLNCRPYLHSVNKTNLDAYSKHSHAYLRVLCACVSLWRWHRSVGDNI